MANRFQVGGSRDAGWTVIDVTNNRNVLVTLDTKSAAEQRAKELNGLAMGMPAGPMDDLFDGSMGAAAWLRSRAR